MSHAAVDQSAGQDAPPPTEDRRAGSTRLALGGVLLGMGFGGFVDGIVLHQILQWHHMGTAAPEHGTFPQVTVDALTDNTRWDGLFHAGTWCLAIVGLVLVWRSLDAARAVTWRTLVALCAIGWGLFNVVEGIVDHHILRIHHVRDDLGGPLAWDLGFLAFGVALVVAGWALRRSDRPTRRHP